MVKHQPQAPDTDTLEVACCSLGLVKVSATHLPAGFCKHRFIG